MRDGWEKMSLTDFVWFQRGFDLPKRKFREGGVPVLGSTSILGYHDKAKVEAPGIVTGRSGTLGQFQYSEVDFWPHNTTLWVKDFKGNDPRFTYYLLQSLDFSLFNSGGAVPTLNRNVLGSFKVSVPPLPTQRKIASILSAYDDLIENNLKRIQLLEELAQQTYEEWFVRMRFPGHESATWDEETGLPEGWEKVELNQIAELIRDSIHPDDLSEAVPYIGLEHIPRKSFTLDNWETSNKINSLKYQFRKNDILFGKIRPYFHKVGVALNNGIASSDTIILRPKFISLHGLLLQTVFSKHFVDTATQSSNGTKMPRANWKVLKKYPVILPTEDLINEYEEFSKNVISSISCLVKQNAHLKEARDLLLPRLMTGLVDVEELPGEE